MVDKDEVCTDLPFKNDPTKWSVYYITNPNNFAYEVKKVYLLLKGLYKTLNLQLYSYTHTIFLCFFVLKIREPKCDLRGVWEVRRTNLSEWSRSLEFWHLLNRVRLYKLILNYGFKNLNVFALAAAAVAAAAAVVTVL